MFLALFVAVQARLLALMGGQGVLNRSTRGVTFIEYALLGGIAVIVGLIFRSQLTSIFNDLFSGIQDVMGS